MVAPDRVICCLRSVQWCRCPGALRLMSLSRNPPETRYAATDAGYVAYQVFGRGPPDVVFIASWLSNLEVMWEEPSLARYFDRLSSFCRVVYFDKRGTGVSDPVPLVSLPTIDEWMDDAKAVMSSAGVERAALVGDGHGGPMAMLFSATYPDQVSALVLVNSFARLARDDDYPIGMPEHVVQRAIDLLEGNWGTAQMFDVTAPSMAGDTRLRSWLARYQRLGMPPGAAATMYRWVLRMDVRSVLHAIKVPTLVVHRADAAYPRAEFGRYLADHITIAKYVELPGADTQPFHVGDFVPVLDEVEEFLTGVRARPVSDRTLATVMLTDITGSTDHAARLGDDRWLDLLGEHDRLTRDHLDRYRGREIQTTGDGFVAIFDGPTRAVTCAAQLAETVRSLGIEIRAGVHTGEIETTRDGIGGIAVHIAARIADTADDSDVVVSSTVKDLVVGSGIAFESRGVHRLKGIPDEWPLYAVTELP